MSITLDCIALTDQYSNEVKILAGRLSRKWHLDTDDVLQDLNMILLIEGAKYNPKRGAIWRWLTWKLQNHYRKSKAIRSVPPDTLNCFAAQTPEPSISVATSDHIEHLLLEIEKLPRRERIVLTSYYGLRCHSRQTLREIGLNENISRQYASRMRRSAIRSIRERWGLLLSELSAD